MILADVNVLIHAYRDDASLHGLYRPWLESLINGDEPYGVSPLALSGLMRIVTNPRIYPRPDPVADVVSFAQSLVNQPHCRVIHPGPRHWQMFCELCRTTKATGDLIPDAWFAALAIEHGCEWITEDRDFARFPGLRWRSLSKKSAK